MYDELSRIRNRDLYRPDEILEAIGWTKSLPWLYYPNGISTTALDSNGVNTELQFRGGSLQSRSVSKLMFVLATYTLSGTYLGLFPLELQTQVCSPADAHRAAVAAMCLQDSTPHHSHLCVLHQDPSVAAAMPSHRGRPKRQLPPLV